MKRRPQTMIPPGDPNDIQYRYAVLELLRVDHELDTGHEVGWKFMLNAVVCISCGWTFSEIDVWERA